MREPRAYLTWNEYVYFFAGRDLEQGPSTATSRARVVERYSFTPLAQLLEQKRRCDEVESRDVETPERRPQESHYRLEGEEVTSSSSPVREAVRALGRPKPVEVVTVAEASRRGPGFVRRGVASFGSGDFYGTRK